MPPAHVHGFSLRVGAVKFSEAQMTDIRAPGFPAGGRNLRPHLAIDERRLAAGKTVGVNPCQQALCDSRRRRQFALEKNIAGTLRRIARLQVITIVNRLDFALVKENAALSPNEIHVAFHVTIRRIDTPAQQQRILKTVEVAHSATHNGRR